MEDQLEEVKPSMSITRTDHMNLNILSRAADLSQDNGLEFDDVADHCNRTLSGDLQYQAKNKQIVGRTASLVEVSPAGSGPARGMKAVKAGKTHGKKRTWKKPKDKPKRPLSAYNLFFQHERENIFMAIAASEGFDPEEARREIHDTSVEGKKRRRHRKSRGKIGFAALAKNIAEKWKALDAAAKSPFEARAMQEKERYKAELDVWKKEQKIKKEKLVAAALKTLTEADAALERKPRVEDEAPLYYQAKPSESCGNLSYSVPQFPNEEAGDTLPLHYKTTSSRPYINFPNYAPQLPNDQLYAREENDHVPTPVSENFVGMFAHSKMPNSKSNKPRY